MGELTRQEGVATLRGMIRRQPPTTPTDAFDDFADDPAAEGIEDALSAGAGQPSKDADRWFSNTDLSALPIAGLTQRRVALLLGIGALHGSFQRSLNDFIDVLVGIFKSVIS